MPYSTVRQPDQCSTDSRTLLWSTLMKKISQGEGEKDTRDKINAMVYEERDWEMTALTPLSVIDLCWFCLACALFGHEHVHCWSLPDDSLHDEISLPADHMTYRMLRGVLTRTEYPPCIPHVIILMSWLRFPPALTSNLCLSATQCPGTYYFKSAEHMGLMLPESACK